jgi:hypothetical protein
VGTIFNPQVVPSELPAACFSSDMFFTARSHDNLTTQPIPETLHLAQKIRIYGANQVSRLVLDSPASAESSGRPVGPAL